MRTLKKRRAGVRPRVASRWAFFLGLALLATTAAFAQTERGAKEYTPWEGQPGKDVVWVPTRETAVDKMLDLAKVTPQDYVIDLGSGDGRTVIAAAKRGARSLGIEYNPDLAELSKHNAAKEGVADKTQFVEADIFQSDFFQASVISLFLLPELNLKLRPQRLNLKPGTRIVSNTFPMGEWTPDETADVAEECATYCTALLWIVPAKVKGEWNFPGGRFVLAQSFQTVGGTISVDSKTMPIGSGRLDGERIAFTAGDVKYTGRVRGNMMQGEFKSASSAGSWSAVRVDSR
jgi:SAM-dependent methyltransferase